LSFKNQILLGFRSSFSYGILSFIGFSGAVKSLHFFRQVVVLRAAIFNLIGIVSCLASTILYTKQSRSAKQQFTSNKPINRTQTRWLELILRHFSQQVRAVY
jgi:uncharacterized membrane protein YedE/YeeE